MKILRMIIVFGLALSLCILGCEKKKEEQAIPKAGEKPQMVTPLTPETAIPPQTPMPSQMPASPHGDMPKVTKKVVVPDNVKSTWGKVRLVLEDRTAKTTQEYVVKVDSSLEIPNTGLKIAVGKFLPDFKIQEDIITSGSNEAKNPAVQVEVFEKGKSIFKGWLYVKFPQIHSFEHERYGLALKEGVKG